MQVHIRTFNVGKGDCIAFWINDEEEQFNVLIDCGCLSDEVWHFVTSEFKAGIDLLVATHIDDDHIPGLSELLDRDGCPVVKKIWYNCFQYLPERKINEFSSEELTLITDLKKRLEPVNIEREGKIASTDAKLLAEKILSKKELSDVWERNLISEDSMDYVPLGGKWGRFIILSPAVNDWKKDEETYRNLFCKFLYKEKESAYKGDAYLYELLTRIELMIPDDAEEEDISDEKLTKATLQKMADKKIGTVSKCNKASLAFIWEKDNKKVLFLADAHPRQIVETMKCKFPNEKRPIICELIKVSHHGSDHNTSIEQIKEVDSAHYFFTGGDEGSRPGYASLARILISPLPKEVDGTNIFNLRELNFNVETEIVKEFDRYQKETNNTEFNIVLDNSRYDFTI